MIRPVNLLASLLACASLAACAGNPAGSYVAPLTVPADAQTLAAGIADFMASSLPAASTTLALEPPAPEQSGNALTPALANALRRRGFATVDANADAVPPGARRVRYRVTPMDGGDLVRLTIDGGAIQGNRFFARNPAGTLQAGGPFTVLGVESVIVTAPETPARRRVGRKPRVAPPLAPPLGLVTADRSAQAGSLVAGAGL